MSRIVLPWPSRVMDPGARVLVVMAHPDDEMSCGGLAQRLPSTARFLWVTDGDGLAESLQVRPAELAAARRLETEAAMAAVGVSGDRLRFLGQGEIGLYQALRQCQQDPRKRHEVFGRMRDVGRLVAAEVMAFRPDVVVTMGWQGAQPIHDLVHLWVRRALDRLPEALLFEVPILDLAWPVPLRFPPWHRDPVHEVRLTAREWEAKARMMACWISQDSVLAPVRSIVRGLDCLVRVGGRRVSMEDLLQAEHFAAVPRDRDYTRSPHGTDLLDYLLDAVDGPRILFRQTLAPIAHALAADGQGQSPMYRTDPAVPA